MQCRLYVVMKKARKLGIHLRQCLMFLLLHMLGLSTLMLLSFIVQLPPILNGAMAMPATTADVRSGIQILWLACIQLPLLAVSFMFASGEPGATASPVDGVMTLAQASCPW